MGNRVIYPSQVREKTLQFTNGDASPVLVQLWLDINNPHSTPETADAPFMASPQIFRINPHSGQMVRLMYSGNGLPADRESLFYLNFLQVPAVRQADLDKNKLLLLVTNRLKVFYRPEGLSGEANQVGSQLRIAQKGNQLQVSNPTPYYANISFARGIVANKSIRIDQAAMLPPFAHAQWQLSDDLLRGELKLELGIINDYGTEVRITRDSLR
ncbi:fimbrial biogenesis chaperone [Serratia fonticola]|uniref:fimbrial biogenesis chaperone n=1 Tax=Serratia fonticola TaxID=47917 RepID=UPI002115F3FE|nr:molecular chaperone [Serratia fonticola]